MNQNKLNSTLIIIFFAITNIFSITALGFNILINEFNQSIWNMVIILLFLSILLLLLFKGYNQQYNPLKDIQNKPTLKVIVILYLLMVSLILILISSTLIKNFFYTKTPLYIFIIITTVCAIILSYQGFKLIINTFSIFFVFIALFYILPIFFLRNRDFSLLLPIDIDFSKVYLITLLLIFPLDNVLMIFYSSQVKNGIKRKDLIITTLIFLLYFLYITIDSLSLLGADFYKDMQFGGFYRWLLVKGNRFFENNDILLLIIVTIVSIYRLGLYFNLIRLIIPFPKKKHYVAIMGAIFVFLALFLKNYYELYQKSINFILLILLILILTIYSYLAIKSWRRKINEQ